MNIDLHLKNAFKFIKEEPIYAILGSFVVMLMNVATLGVLAGPIFGGYLGGILNFLRTNRKPQFKDLFEGFQRLGYLFSYIVVNLVTILGFVLLVVPGLLFLTWWIYVLLLMIDTNMPLSIVMAESRRKVQDKGFLMHLVFIITLAVLPTLLINAASMFLPPLKLLQLVVLPLQSACLVSLYLEQFPKDLSPPEVSVPN